MLEQVIPNKAGWTRVTFGDVVRLSKARSKDPEFEGYERVVGLEHIDPGDLRIRRWADISDGTTFTSVFQPGQVLFGKRRAYQRKVAVADFAGVCSGDIYALEPSSDALMPELLPFICQTDAFFEHAVGTSAGSLSPRTNWKSLASFEFQLPPIQEQARLVEPLSGSAVLAERLEDALEKASDMQAAFVAWLAKEMNDAFDLASIGEIAQVQYGLTVNRARRHNGEAKSYLRVANVARGRLDLDEVKEIGVLDGDENYELQKGDVLIVEGHANRQEIGRACLWQNEIPGALHQNHLIRIRTGEALDPRFVCALINSPVGQKHFQSRAKSSSGLNTINSTVVREFQVPLPPMKVQQEELSKLDQIADATIELQCRAFEARGLFKRILKEGFAK